MILIMIIIIMAKIQGLPISNGSSIVLDALLQWRKSFRGVGGGGGGDRDLALRFFARSTDTHNAHYTTHTRARARTHTHTHTHTHIHTPSELGTVYFCASERALEFLIVLQLKRSTYLQ